MALILFVDDEPLTLQLLSQAAEIVGHEAITAETGEEVLALSLERQPDLIMLDMNLAGTDGLEVLSQLRANQQTVDIPVIILSAGTGVDVAENVKEAGAVAYMSKPIRLQALIEVIRDYTQQ